MKQSKNIILTSVIAITLGLASVTASAADQIYGGIGTGLAIPTGDYSNTLDDSQAWKVFGGQDINENLSIEGGYTKFGEMDVSNSTTDNDNSVEYTAFQVSPVAVLPIGNRLSLFIKAGFLAWDSDTEINGTDNGVDIFYGAGVDYILSENLSVKGTWESYTFDEVEANLYSVSAVFHF